VLFNLTSFKPDSDHGKLHLGLIHLRISFFLKKTVKDILPMFFSFNLFKKNFPSQTTKLFKIFIEIPITPEIPCQKSFT